MSRDFSVAGKDYRARKMDAMQQFHIARRLTPVIGALIEAVPKDAIKGDKVDLSKIDPLKMLEPIAGIISKMSDEDSEYILFACMENCERSLGKGAGWSAVKVKGGKIMYDDIDLPVMLQIFWAVVQENLGNFFPEAPQGLTEQA